jgi:tetratricopeptide (TPR) repeat protein
MTKPQLSLLPAIAVLTLMAGCHRNEQQNTSALAGPASQPGDDMTDPEMRKLDDAVRQEPNSPKVYWDRSTAWFSRGRFDRAARDLDEAVRLDPTNSAYFDSRGFAYHMDNRQEGKALADYGEALRLDPANHHALNNRAYLLATTLDDRFRDGKKALADALKACEMTNWSRPGYLDTLAVAYAEVGDFEQAIKWQNKALEDLAFAKDWGENARKQLDLFRQRKPYRE